METKLKFKVGDKVRVKSLEWYNSQEKDRVGLIHLGIGFTAAMSKKCGRILTIRNIYEDYYIVNESIFSWQDWMLEDEVVAEEKKEVEQQNKNDMETKEMTLKEAQDFVNNKKIMCFSEEETKNVQTKLFELGFRWRINGRNMLSILSKNLLIGANDNILKLLSFNEWVESTKPHLPNDELLAIQIKEEKPKFDPKTLQVFDKVLVKNRVSNEWFPYFFESFKENHYITIGGLHWDFCIPYNNDTKHLSRTHDEAPEFYNIW